MSEFEIVLYLMVFTFTFPLIISLIIALPKMIKEIIGSDKE